MIRVLVVDDEIVTAEAHASYLARLRGFELAGLAHTGAEAIRLIRETRRPDAAAIDLVLLDMNLPDHDGLDVCRSIRAASLPIDVIAITAVRDLEVVRQAVSAGIVQYLIKPFTFSAFAEKLAAYSAFRAGFSATSAPTTQAEVDRALSSLHTSSSNPLPKGLAPETLGQVTGLLQGHPRGWSAVEVGEANGLSRVTARRYLEHLATLGQATRAPRHGTPGRPEIEYRWA